MLHKKCWILICMMLAAILPTIAYGQFPLPQKVPGLLFVAPDNTFQVQLPAGWEPHLLASKPDFVEFQITNRRGTAFMHVQRTTVPAGAQPHQLLLRAIENRLIHMPHFNELMRRTVDIRGYTASSVLGLYWFQGNAQYPRTIEEMYLIVGTDAFEMHFECFQPLSEHLSGDLNIFYSSFTARPNPQAAPTKPPVNENSMENLFDKFSF